VLGGNVKIYVVMVSDQESNEQWVACDWIGDDPYELDKQEVFFTQEHAQEVFDSVNKHGTTYTVSLHEFEV
jgi:hypothetical protein